MIFSPVAEAVDEKNSATVAEIFSLHAQKQGYTEAQKSQNHFIQKKASEILFFKKNLPTEIFLFLKEFAFQNFGLRPYKPSVAVAVAVTCPSCPEV